MNVWMRGVEVGDGDPLETSPSLVPSVSSSRVTVDTARELRQGFDSAFLPISRRIEAADKFADFPLVRGCAYKMNHRGLNELRLCIATALRDVNAL